MKRTLAILSLLLVALTAKATSQQAADTVYVVKVKWNWKGSSMDMPMTDKVGPFTTRAAADSAVAEIGRNGCWPRWNHPDERQCSQSIFQIKIETERPKR